MVNAFQGPWTSSEVRRAGGGAFLVVMPEVGTLSCQHSLAHHGSTQYVSSDAVQQ